jgi:nitrogen regulatory protein PII
MTATDVRGLARRVIVHEENVPLEGFIEKVRLEIVAHIEMVETIVSTIVHVAHTGVLST